MKDSKYLSAELVPEASGIMQTVTQQALAGGTAPTVKTEDYSNAFNAFEMYSWNVLVLDTVDSDVKALAKTYMDRIHDNGALGICVLGEEANKSLAERMMNANLTTHLILFMSEVDITIRLETEWKNIFQLLFRLV